MAMREMLERLAGETPAGDATLDGTLREVRRVALAFPPYWRDNRAWRAAFEAAKARATAAGATGYEIAVAALKP